eukprot:jgi/Picre1/30799/NNA_006159.t1
MSNVKQADVVSHVALADVLECRTLPRSVAANLEKVAGSDGQVSVDALVDMVVTDHESGGDRKVLRRSVLGITIAMVCLSAVVCGLVFGSVHLTTQMQVQDGVLHARDSADTVMHSGTTVAAFSPSDLKTLDNLQMSSMQTLLFSEEDGTMHMYRVSSVSSRPNGEFEVVATSGEEFVVSAEGTILVINNGSSSGGGDDCNSLFPSQLRLSGCLENLLINCLLMLMNRRGAIPPRPVYPKSLGLLR